MGRFVRNRQTVRDPKLLPGFFVAVYVASLWLQPIAHGADPAAGRPPELSNSIDSKGAGASPKSAAETHRDTAAMQESVRRAIERNGRSVVSIARIKNRQAVSPLAPFDRAAVLESLGTGSFPSHSRLAFAPNGYATGVVVDSKGLILTSAHVLLDDCRYVICSQGRAYDAKVIGADPRSDLAVLEIVEAVPQVAFKAVKLGDASTLRRGQMAVALGNPRVIAHEGTICGSIGVISNLGCKAPPIDGENHPRRSRPTLHHFGTLIQCDVQLNASTSGSALVNIEGEMVGLTTSLALTGSDRAAGYAQPVDETFLRVVATLKQGREVEYGLLGVTPQPLTAAESRAGLSGARVGSIDYSSAAYRSGLRVGDIITSIAGAAIASEDDLMLHIGRQPAGVSLPIEISRGGQTFKLVATLSKYPVIGKQVFTPEPAWRGLRVDYASVRVVGPFSHPLGPDLYEGCVWIRDVESNSPAWQSGLRTGMFITHVDDARVTTPAQFRAATTGKQREVKIRLGGLRSGEDPVKSVAAAKP